MSKTVIQTKEAPAAVGPYSQAIRVGNMVYTAGQVGIDPETGALRQGLEAQTRQVLANLRAVLAAAGTDMDHVIKTTIYLADIGTFKEVNAIYGEVFREDPPARSTVEVAALPLGALVEIEAIAVVA